MGIDQLLPLLTGNDDIPLEGLIDLKFSLNIHWHKTDCFLPSLVGIIVRNSVPHVGSVTMWLSQRSSRAAACTWLARRGDFPTPVARLLRTPVL